MMDYISLSELSDYLHFQAEVSKDNMTAQKAYIKQGFQHLNEIRKQENKVTYIYITEQCETIMNIK